MKENWEAYALDACQTLLDASMFWDSEYEKDHPGLKRARTMAAKALRLQKELPEEED